MVESGGGFNAVFGTLRVRIDPGGRARCRAETGPAQANLGGSIHGGFLLAFADHAAFVGIVALGRLPGWAVTIGLGTTFIGRGEPGVPIDAIVEVTGETRGMLFVRGLIEQDGRTIGSFEATLRKRDAPPARA